MYYRKLQFLANSTANNDTDSNYQSSDTTGSGVDNTDNADLMPPPKDHIESTRKKQKMNAVDKQIHDILQKSLNAKEQNETGRLTKGDDDKLLFCLSLHSELKKVPENQRLTTKIQLLNVIKEAQNYHQSLTLQTNQHQYMYSTPTYSGYTTAKPPTQQWSTTPPPPPSSWSPSPTGSSQDSDNLNLFE